MVRRVNAAGKIFAPGAAKRKPATGRVAGWRPGEEREDGGSAQANFTASSAANKPDDQQNGQYRFNDPR